MTHTHELTTMPTTAGPRVPRESWVGASRWCRRVPHVVAHGLALAFTALQCALGDRMTRGGWVRFDIPVQAPDARETDVTLVPLSEATMPDIRANPEVGADQLQSGFRFWDHGLRGAYCWWDGGAPLCVQWLLTAGDNPRLRRLPHWAGMYPPLPTAVGQVENLYAFADTRRRGVATLFERALLDEAWARGMTVLRTHIAAHNEAARAWAMRFGWRPYGRILRFQIDLPFVRRLPVFIHVVDERSEAGASRTA